MPSSSVDGYLTEGARKAVAEAIAEAGGNEVFLVGRTAACGRVDSVQVYCRGHEGAVPALQQVGLPGEVVLHNHPSGDLRPSDPDLSLASHYGQKAVGFFIVNNDVSEVYVVVEAFLPREKPSDPQEVETLLTGETGLPRILVGYEARPGQVQFARAVAEAQNEGRVLVAEAGTGTGKSLAYLIPSALRALNNGERVAVATRTRHLQDQLYIKDAPLAQRLLPKLKVSVLKGRTNYLCRRKLADRLAELDADSDADEWESLSALERWAETSPTGERGDLGFAPPIGHWQLVQSQTDHTLRARCRFFDQCFYYRSRREATSAQVLLVNHHLLLADRALRLAGSQGGLLPDYEHVVLDEGHHLEEAATDFAGERVTGRGVLQALGRICPAGRRKKGIAARLLQASGGPDPDLGRLRAAVQVLADRVDRCRLLLREHLEALADELLRRLDSRSTETARTAAQRGRRSGTFRLAEDLEQSDSALFGDLSDRFEILGQALRHTAKGIGDVLAEMLDQAPSFRERHRQAAFDLSSLQRRMEEGARTFGVALSPDAERVRWIEVSKSFEGTSEARICLAPVEVGAVLRQHLVDEMRSVVITSATLRVDGEFDHFLQRSGLDTPDLRLRLCTEALASPFDYPNQVFLALPTDLPAPDRGSYVGDVADAIVQAVRISQGRAFVLLTSYRSLHQIADAVSRQLSAEFALLRQGDLPRTQLLERFVAARKGVLFGTDSFWEGVDVRGDALSLVVLPRLPFRVPTEPIQQARCERIVARGGDAFADLSLPQAVLRFRQGFGRLIRHRDDRGTVLVLDTRLHSRSYGPRFLQSLPDGLKGMKTPAEPIYEEMERFFRSR